MKKLFFILLAVTALSCSSSDDNNPTAIKEPNIQLQKMEIRDSSGLIYTVKYSYKDNHLSKMTILSGDGPVAVSSTYSYTNDQLVKRTDFDSGGDINGAEFYVYDNNRIVSTKYLNVSTARHYLYNDLGQVIKVQRSEDDTTYNDVAYYEYDTAGNLAKSTDATNNNVIYFTFDNKKRVESLLYNEAFLKLSEYSVAGNNNVVSADYGEEIYDYEYEYNTEGYPTKKVLKTDGKVAQETTYFYNN